MVGLGRGRMQGLAGYEAVIGVWVDDERWDQGDEKFLKGANVLLRHGHARNLMAQFRIPH